MDIRRLLNKAGLGRAVLLLGLLAGLFAMHGMAADHESFPLAGHPTSTAHAQPAPTTGTVDVPMNLPASGATDAAASEPNMASGPAVVSRSSEGDGSGHHAHTALETCLAVLVGLGALVLLRMLGRSDLRSAGRGAFGTAGGWVAPTARDRRFCLSLTELGLSRT